MKTLLASLLLTLSLSASAEAVFLFPNCNYSPTQGQCTVINTSGKQVTCNVQTTGQTKRGAYLSNFNYLYLSPGMMGWTYLYNNNPVNDEITSINATAFCNTVN